MSETRAPAGVGWTSLLTAHARARESLRTDPLVVDPWAEVLVAAAGGLGPTPGIDTSEMWGTFLQLFSGRTPFYDAHVRGAVEQGARQVVLLAAGLDARAARLPLPAGVPVFEVDQAGVLDFKAAALAERGLDVDRRVPVPADLREDWAATLRAAGFDHAQPTAWVAEGLLMYLDADAADRLLTTMVEQSAPGSTIALEYFERRVSVDDLAYADDAERAVMVRIAELFESGPDASPAAWFARHGLTVERVTDLAEELRAHGRPVPAPFGGDGRADPLVLWLASGRLPQRPG